MFDLGWTELLLIGVVALIVVGPKDLPILFRKAGQFVGKAKGMAREFSRAMEDAADDTGMRDIAKTVKGAVDPKKMGLDKLNEAAESYKKWQPGSETAKLAADRAEAARKVHEATAQRALERQAAEAKALEEGAKAAPAKAAPAKATLAKAAAPKPKAAPKAAKPKAAPKAKAPAKDTQ